MQSPKDGDSNIELTTQDSSSSSSVHDITITAAQTRPAPYAVFDDADDDLGDVIRQYGSAAPPDVTVDVDTPPGGMPTHTVNRVEIQRSAFARREAERAPRQQIVTTDAYKSESYDQFGKGDCAAQPDDDNLEDPVLRNLEGPDAAARALERLQEAGQQSVFDRCVEALDSFLWEHTGCKWYNWFYIIVLLLVIGLCILSSVALWTKEYKDVNQWFWQWRQAPVIDIKTVDGASSCPEGYVRTGPNEYSASQSGRKYHNTLWCGKQICVKRSKKFTSYSDVWSETSCGANQVLCPTGGCVDAGNFDTDCPITGVVFEETADPDSDPDRTLTCGGQTFKILPKREFASEGDPDPDKRFASPFLGFISTVNAKPVEGEKPGNEYVYNPPSLQVGPRFTFQNVASRLATEFYDDNQTPENMRRLVNPATDEIHLFSVHPLLSSHECRDPGEAIKGVDRFTDKGVIWTFTDALIVTPKGTRMLLIWNIVHIGLIAVWYLVTLDTAPSKRKICELPEVIILIELGYSIAIWVQSRWFWRYGKNVESLGCITDPFAAVGYTNSAVYFKDSITDMTNLISSLYTTTMIVNIILGIQLLVAILRLLAYCLRNKC